ncbi:MAG: FG-GAP-like repeat-containing protein [Rhodothermales bacterium]
MQHPIGKRIKCVFLSLIFLSIALNGRAQTFKLASGPVTNTVSDSRSVNFLDLNNDGWEDLYISNGPENGQADLLYINDGTGQFTQVTNMAIISASNPSDGASFADYNNDGHIDGVVSSWYGAEDLLYLNDGAGNLNYNGNAGLVGGSFAETAAFGDYDNDGWLDLYVTNSGTSKNNFLYRNLQNGKFERITNHVLVNDADLSRGVNWGDFNNDGITDVFVANESNSPNHIFWGRGGGTFEKLTQGDIVSANKSTMTGSWGDIDNDGDLDLFAGNSNFFRPLNNQLYRNLGGSFEEITDDPTVLGLNCTFGSAFGDYDNDGDLDLVVSNGFCNTNLPNELYENQGDGTFVNVSDEFESNEAICSFGVAWGDVNNDGFLDVAFANCKNSSSGSEQANTLMLNEGNDNSWLAVKLTGVATNRDGVGARVEVKATINGQAVWQMREVQSQSGYAGQNSLVAHFGFGDAAIVDTLVVHWPAGNRQFLTNVAVYQRINIAEVINTSTEAIPARAETISLDVFPNPASDTATVKIQVINNTRSGQQEGQLFLYNMMGQIVLKQSVQINPGISVMTFDIGAQNLAAGSYRVVLHVGGEQQTKNLILY